MPAEPLGREPLLGYLRVQGKADAELIKLLNAAAAQTSRDIAVLRDKQGIGAQVRRAQLSHALSAIRAEQSRLWTQIGNSVNARRAAMAAEAARQASDLDNFLMGLVDPGARDAIIAGNYLTAQSGLEAMGVRVGGQSFHDLSQRVYKNAQLSSGQINNIINASLAEGLAAREIASRVSKFIRPDVPGGVSYAAMRLGRTELNNAYHSMSKQMAVGKPWVLGLRWHLSGSHPKPDVCNDYAAADHGLGPGVYAADDVPDKPHPQCFCYTTPVTPDRREFIDSYFNGEYDQWLNDNGLIPVIAQIDEEGILTSREKQVRTHYNRAAKDDPSFLSMTSREQAQVLSKSLKLSVDDIESNILSWQSKVKRVVGPNARTAQAGQKVTRATRTSAPPVVEPTPVPIQPQAAPFVSTRTGETGIDWGLRTIRLSNSGAPQELIDRMASFLEDWEQRMPGISRRLDVIQSSTKKPGGRPAGRANAWYYSLDRSITYNTRVLEDLRAYVANVKRAMQVGWYTRAGIEGKRMLEVPGLRTFIHEFGHHIDYSAISGFDRYQIFKALADDIGVPLPPSIRARQEIFIDHSPVIQAWMTKNKGKIMRAVSEYGTKNNAELMAEVWAGYTMGDSRPLIQKLGKMMEEAARNSERLQRWAAVV